jgi:F-type H+-transporting ATPase subunit epsilon
MADRLELDIVTPERRVLQAQAAEVTAPGTVGEFGVLPGHVPFVTSLKAGVLAYRDAEGGPAHAFAVGSGLVEIAEDKVTVLVDRCEAAEDIDRAAAEAERDQAAARVKALQPNDPGMDEAVSALEMAEARVLAAAKAIV